MKTNEELANIGITQGLGAMYIAIAEEGARIIKEAKDWNDTNKRGDKLLSQYAAFLATMHSQLYKIAPTQMVSKIEYISGALVVTFLTGVMVGYKTREVETVLGSIEEADKGGDNEQA